MMDAKLSFRFVLGLYVCITFARFCYTDNRKFPSFGENVELQKLLNVLNKPPVKSIKSPDGDIIDCVQISRQPAFDHPLLKNHTIKMRPNNYPPKRINVVDNKVMNGSTHPSSSSSISQLWHSNGKCSKGTIPIRRTKKEDVLRASSVKSYGKKNSSSFVGQPSSNKPEVNKHEYAVASTHNGQFYGTKGIMNLWNPEVEDNNEFSLAQTWIVGGSYDDSSLNTIEAGWQVYPGMYGDTKTRLFIYWTGDAYQKTGCYNLCSGFIQINNKIAIGGSISPTSQMSGTQHALTILIWKDGHDGDWWMQLGNGELVGYWPSSLFTNLRKSASKIQWGGEVVNLRTHDGHHTTTQMGSGRFPEQGYRKASYIRNIETVDGSNTLITPVDGYVIRTPNCYDIFAGIDKNWGRYIYFGGPGGRNENCS